jgi:hypothetical protein
MTMKITEARIRPANEDFVKGYTSICFDDCSLVHDIRVIKGPLAFASHFLTGRTASAVSEILLFRLLFRSAVVVPDVLSIVLWKWPRPSHSIWLQEQRTD